MRHDAFRRELAAALGLEIPSQQARPVGGGSINHSLRLETSRGPVFIKCADPQALDMFEAEAVGLQALRDAGAVRVPNVLAVGVRAETAFLALEWIEFGVSDARAEATLGEQLARQHRVTADRFGWSRDNTIGSTPQPNAWSDDWIEFLRERRLGYQLDLALRNGAAARVIDRGRRLCDSLAAFFSDYRPVPSLLHGDLWGGNWSADTSGRPVIFDPAVYFGDREADIAMTKLFGGFGRAFYAAYDSTWPRAPGADRRCTLYNLYHVLNHYNLFGGGYLSQAGTMIDSLLAELA
jgi:protein-ribulosamine 3-kinase